MNLYYSKEACSLIIRIVINELKLESNFIAVNLADKTTENNVNFLTINPKGYVPTLEISPGKVLTENAVILQYLADTYKAYNLLPEMGDFERYHVLEWLNYMTTEMHKSFAPLFNPKLSQQTKEELKPFLLMKFTYINKQLGDKKYLLGSEFTLPDAYLFVLLRWAQSLKFDLSDCSNLNRYFEALKHRESIKKSLEQEGLN